MFEHLPPIAYAMFALALFSYAAAIGGFIAAIGATVRVVIFRRLPARLSCNQIERRLLLASVIAAVLGSAWLFLAPSYGSHSCSSTVAVSSTTTTTQRSEVGADGERIEVVEYAAQSTAIPDENSDCKRSTETFYEVNGPSVIPLFTIPIVFTLIPFAFYALRIRPIIEGLIALLLGAQLLIGLSMYGAAFGPSGVLMVLAALAALRTAGNRQIVG